MNLKHYESNEAWDCPSCGRPTPPEIDVECHCGMMSSHHVSVRELCKRLREAQQRESSLIVKNKKLEDEVNEQARLLGMSAERECDLRGKIERFERDDIHTCHNRCQKPMCVLRRERDAERDLADRLADGLLDTLCSWITAHDAEGAAQALTAWKEARSE